MNVYSNKGICQYFGRNYLDGCRDNNDELTLVDSDMKLLLCHLQELTCLRLVLIYP